MADKLTLLPCPFCGSVAEIERPGTARQSMIIVCTYCGGRMESGDVVERTPVDEWAWNRRVPSPALTAAREALESVTSVLQQIHDFAANEQNSRSLTTDTRAFLVGMTNAALTPSRPNTEQEG